MWALKKHPFSVISYGGHSFGFVNPFFAPFPSSTWVIGLLCTFTMDLKSSGHPRRPEVTWAWPWDREHEWQWPTIAKLLCNNQNISKLPFCRIFMVILTQWHPRDQPGWPSENEEHPIFNWKTSAFPHQTGMVFSAYWHPRSGLLNGVWKENNYLGGPPSKWWDWWLFDIQNRNNPKTWIPEEGKSWHREKTKISTSGTKSHMS
jgi:hypothetical protein